MKIRGICIIVKCEEKRKKEIKKRKKEEKKKDHWPLTPPLLTHTLIDDINRSVAHNHRGRVQQTHGAEWVSPGEGKKAATIKKAVRGSSSNVIKVTSHSTSQYLVVLVATVRVGPGLVADCVVQQPPAASVVSPAHSQVCTVNSVQYRIAGWTLSLSLSLSHTHTHTHTRTHAHARTRTHARTNAHMKAKSNKNKNKKTKTHQTERRTHNTRQC